MGRDTSRLPGVRHDERRRAAMRRVAEKARMPECFDRYASPGQTAPGRGSRAFSVLSGHDIKPPLRSHGVCLYWRQEAIWVRGRRY